MVQPDKVWSDPIIFGRVSQRIKDGLEVGPPPAQFFVAPPKNWAGDGPNSEPPMIQLLVP